MWSHDGCDSITHAAAATAVDAATAVKVCRDCGSPTQRLRRAKDVESKKCTQFRDHSYAADAFTARSQCCSVSSSSLPPTDKLIMCLRTWIAV